MLIQHHTSHDARILPHTHVFSHGRGGTQDSDVSLTLKNP